MVQEGAIRVQKHLAALRVDFSVPVALGEAQWRQLYDGLVLVFAEQGITRGDYRVEISTSTGRGGWHESSD